jgi:hypothetical protein
MGASLLIMLFGVAIHMLGWLLTSLPRKQGSRIEILQAARPRARWCPDHPGQLSDINTRRGAHDAQPHTVGLFRHFKLNTGLKSQSAPHGRGEHDMAISAYDDIFHGVIQMSDLFIARI